jgi:hypothetical protein
MLAIQVHTHVTDGKQGLRNNIIQTPAYPWNAWGDTAPNRE